jgi:hypothetical protein
MYWPESEFIPELEFNPVFKKIAGVEKAPQRLSAFINQVRWAGKEIFSSSLLTTFFQGTYLFFNKFTYC